MSFLEWSGLPYVSHGVGYTLSVSDIICLNLTKVLGPAKGPKIRTAIPDSKVHGTNMGPTWVLSAPDGPYVGPMKLAIRDTDVQVASLCLAVIGKIRGWLWSQRYIGVVYHLHHRGVEGQVLNARVVSQLGKTLGSTPIWHGSDTFALGWCLIKVD